MEQPNLPQGPDLLVIIGDGEFAEIAYEYFTHDSPYTVCAFSVERTHLKKTTLYNLPIVPLEEIQDNYLPSQYSVFVAIPFTQLNHLRHRLFDHVKNLGYTCASYISSQAFVWHNVKVGENCFIFENNVIQHHTHISDNVILWSGNHIGHRSHIGPHCFFASHVVVSGYCQIGHHCFLGVNATLVDEISVGDECLVGAGALINRSIEHRSVYRAPRAEKAPKTSDEYFDIPALRP